MAETKPDITSEPSPTTRVMTGGFRGAIMRKRQKVFIIVGVLVVLAVAFIIVQPLFMTPNVSKPDVGQRQSPLDTDSRNMTAATSDYQSLKKTDISGFDQADKYRYYLNLASSLIALKRYDEVFAQLDLAAQQGSSVTYMVLYERGLAYEGKGDKTQARHFYTQAKQMIEQTEKSGDQQVYNTDITTMNIALERVK